VTLQHGEVKLQFDMDLINGGYCCFPIGMIL